MSLYSIFRYTSSKDHKTVYAIVLTWPRWGVLDLGAPEVSSETHVSIIGYDGDVEVNNCTRFQPAID